MLFIDIDLNGESDTDIFSITSILHTKVKIEEPHKKRQITQCQNCQSYGHTCSYCAYPPKCVKCGENHLSSSCTKSPDLPAKCGLCHGRIQPIKRDAQYIKQFPGNTTTTPQARKPSNNQAPKTHPGHVRMQM